MLSVFRCFFLNHDLIMESDEVFFKFHPYHGERILLSENCSVAYRTEGFDNGIVFSEKQLQPGELFVIEVEQNEKRWAGYLRLGLTQLNPSICSSRKIELPKDSLPDLMRLGEGSWIYGLTDLLPNTREISWPYAKGIDNVEVSDSYIETCRGSYSRIALQKTPFVENTPSAMKNLDVGFKVGVVYIPRNDEVADLFYLINGDLFGPYALQIPYKEVPLHVVIDVYGRTRKVRILQIQPGKGDYTFLPIFD